MTRMILWGNFIIQSLTRYTNPLHKFRKKSGESSTAEGIM